MSKNFVITLERNVDDGSGESDVDAVKECEEVFDMLEALFCFIHNEDWFLSCGVEEVDDE